MNAVSVLRAVNAAAGSVTPDLSAQVAKHLLLHAQPHSRGAWELPVAKSATRITFRFGLSGLRWGEEGPAVLVMHGWEGRPTQFRHFVEPLLAAGRQVIALDAPANGASSGSEATLMEVAMSLLEAAVEIRSLDAVIGHSLGAAAVAIALAQGLPAERAVLIASPSRIEDSLHGFAGVLGLPRRASERLGELMGISARELEITQQVSGLKIPALIVHDRDDTAVPFVEGQAIANAWPGARLLPTEGLGHWRVLTDSHVTHQVAAFLTNSERVHDLKH